MDAKQRRPSKIQFDFDGVTKIQVCDPVTWEVLDTLDEAWIHPKEFFMTSPERYEATLQSIEDELDDRIAHFSSLGQELERHRIEQRTRYDLEMIREIGHCQSMENYSLHFDGKRRSATVLSLGFLCCLRSTISRQSR